MDIQWASVLIGFLSGALTGALVTYWRHWLARRRQTESLEFAKAQEAERIRRDDYARALGYHKSRESLRGCDLADQDLAGLYLAKADLQRANLGKADLSGSDLQAANLIGADLQETNLQGANLA
jgi:uncharacterized protein YjbI with pentapeptide repeats